MKDLQNNKLMPILILNAQDQVAFDQHEGIFYTQVDADGMGKAVYRHQIGARQEDDQLVYKETNPDIAVSVSNSLSEEFVMININTTFLPRSNEIWLKNSHDIKEKFWLVQPLEIGVDYQIQHSGEFLYKMTNEDDRKNYSIKRISLP